MLRTILKIFAILILVAVIVGLSVIKSNLSAKREEARLESLQGEYFRAQDSLLIRQLNDTTRFYTDSIKQLEQYYQSQLDSLNLKFGIIDSSQLLQERPEMLLSGADMVRMMTEYDSLVKELPRQLSAKERNLAINKLTSRLTQKYALEPDSAVKLLDRKK